MTDANNWTTGAVGRRFIASYSGGKDSSLAIYHAIQLGEVIGLIVMLEEQGKQSRSHGMPPAIIEAQGRAIGLPVYTAAASWEDYETAFIRLLTEAKEHGAEALVTGDLDMPEVGCWHDEVTRKVGLSLGMPLWRMDHLEVVHSFISLGFTAIVVTVNLALGMKETDLGRQIDQSFIDDLLARGIDPCGEGGEFHTTVTDGPLFKHPIRVRPCEVLRNGDYAFLSLELDE